MATGKYLFATMNLLRAFQMAAGLALPYPEVIPGPGLPSLAELGLTSAQLYNMGMPNICMAMKGGILARHTVVQH